MAALSPLASRLLRLALLANGAFACLSSTLNLIAAWQLIEPSDEAALGITRGEIFGGYAALFLVGVGLIVLGFRIGRKPPCALSRSTRPPGP